MFNLYTHPLIGPHPPRAPHPAQGLEDQLLGTVVTQERPDLANLKSQLVVSNAKMKKELSDIEDRILQLLSASSGNILDDEELINTLAQSKVRAGALSAYLRSACPNTAVPRTQLVLDSFAAALPHTFTRRSQRCVLALCLS